MPSSPRTPRHSRHSSTIEVSPNYDSTPHRGGGHSKNNSIHSPSTPNRFDPSNSIGIDAFSSSGGGGGGATPSNGLGNLADELADAWSGEEGEERSGSEEEDPDFSFQQAQLGEGGKAGGEATRDSGVDVTSSSSPIENQTSSQKMPPPGIKRLNEKNMKNLSLSPPMLSARSGNNNNHHRRQQSEYYGSDYGGDSDMDSPGILPPGLVARMDMVGGLARRGTEENGGERDGVVGKVIDVLRDLGGQSGVEGGATRLITAHTALSTHLLHQTRILHSLTYPLLSPLAPPPPPSLISEILRLLTPLNESLPRPSPAALHSLTILSTLTTDTIQTLNYLSDTLHMSRQTTTTANRRLRSARELVAEMKREEELREEGERWLNRGNWGRRLRDRECKRECEEVLRGFEEVCGGWREKLVLSLGGVEGLGGLGGMDGGGGGGVEGVVVGGA